MARMSNSSGSTDAPPSFAEIEAASECDSQYVRSDFALGGAEKRAEDLVGGVE